MLALGCSCSISTASWAGCTWYKSYALIGRSSVPWKMYSYTGMFGVLTDVLLAWSDGVYIHSTCNTTDAIPQDVVISIEKLLGYRETFHFGKRPPFISVSYKSFHILDFCLKQVPHSFFCFLSPSSPISFLRMLVFFLLSSRFALLSLS